MLEAHIQRALWHFDLDLQLHNGNQIVVLWGPSGCGKTTTLNILAGLLAPEQGSITLHERVLFSSSSHINIPARHRHIGYLLQDYALFPHKTVMQNVRYANGTPLENSTVREVIESGKDRLGKRGRLVIRPSGTEPVIRVMAEGDDETLVGTVVTDIVNVLREAAA